MSGGVKHNAKKDLPERPLPQWKPLPHKRIPKLMEMTVDEVQTHFAEILEFRSCQTCMKEVVLLEYYVSGFLWAKEAKFNPTQISFTMGLLHTLLDRIAERQVGFAENLFELAMDLDAASQHPVSDSDGSPVLSIEQCKILTDYIKNSLFLNYRLYELLFSTAREDVLVRVEKTVEVPSGDDTIAPLEESMPADLFFRYLAPPIHKQEEVNGGESEALQTVGLLGEREEGDMEEKEEDGEFTIQEVKEVLGEVAKDMLESLQADVQRRVKLHEEMYARRLEHLKNYSSQ